MSLPVRSPVQIVWVTPDLNATETALTGRLGVRRRVRMPAVHFAPDSCSYHGEPADFIASISSSYLGGMQLKLIEPVRGQSIYSDVLHRSGPGRHHGGIEAETDQQFTADIVAAIQRGADVVRQGAMAAPAAGVPVVEIAVIPPEIRAFFD